MKFKPSCRRRAGVLGLLLVCVPFAAWGQDGAPPVAAVAAEVRPILNAVRLSGTVVAPRSARVSASVGGLVARVEVEIGDGVEAGDTLIRLDRALAQHEVERAAAAVDEAEAEHADMRRRLRIAERLAQQGNLPKNELEARQAQVRIAAAAVTRLKAEAARARERLDRHTVVAPFAGVVARRATQVGEWVEPGTMVVELVAIENLSVDVPVPQKYFPELKAGVPIELQFDALPDRRFAARRVAVVPVSDPTARTFILRVRPEDDGIPLTPGMSARIAVQLATGKRGIVVPRDAVVRYPDGRTTVWVLAGSGDKATVAERRVRLGRAFDGRVHVRSGLEAGQRVVVRGNELLRPGQRVRVTGDAS